MIIIIAQKFSLVIRFYLLVYICYGYSATIVKPNKIFIIHVMIKIRYIEIHSTHFPSDRHLLIGISFIFLHKQLF